MKEKSLIVVEDENGTFLEDESGHRFTNVIFSEIKEDSPSKKIENTVLIGPGQVTLSFSKMEYRFAKSN